MPGKTIRVTEDRSVDAVFEASVAGDLWRLPQELVTVRPTGMPDAYRISAGGKIGVVETADVRVVVEPKIAGVNLRVMLDPDSPVISGGMTPDEPLEDSLLETLAIRLARLMVARSRRGLRRGYAARHATSDFIRGKLDVPAQLRHARGSGVRFHLEFETLTPEIPANQFPKAVAGVLRERFGPASPVGEALAEAIDSYREVTCLFPTITSPNEFLRLASDESELDLLNLASLIQEGFDPRLSANETRPTPRMLDLHRVFETFVARGLRQRLGEFRVDLQPVVVMGSARATAQANPVARPDLLISAGTTPIWLIDTKWKIVGSTPGPDDWRQVIAGMHVTGCPFGMLIYPGERHQRAAYDIPGGGRMFVQHVRVTGDARGCLESLDRLAAELRDQSGALEEQDAQGRHREV